MGEGLWIDRLVRVGVGLVLVRVESRDLGLGKSTYSFGW